MNKIEHPFSTYRIYSRFLPANGYHTLQLEEDHPPSQDQHMCPPSRPLSQGRGPKQGSWRRSQLARRIYRCSHPSYSCATKPCAPRPSCDSSQGVSTLPPRRRSHSLCRDASQDDALCAPCAKRAAEGGSPAFHLLCGGDDLGTYSLRVPSLP